MVLSYSHGASAVPLIGQTIGDNLAETARRFPDAEALVVSHQDVRLTYRELAAEVEKVARGLLSFGLGKGDRVGIWSPNSAEWVRTLRLRRDRRITVNINPLPPGDASCANPAAGCCSRPPAQVDDFAAMVAGAAAAAGWRPWSSSAPDRTTCWPGPPLFRPAPIPSGRPASASTRHQHRTDGDRLPEGHLSHPTSEQRVLHRRAAVPEATA
jgi:hypothetical protein